mmetsp:Transcript_42668/g.114101  ORF Transcript_42668/g.114101 Transcript_42668/m.114101 type:complete len:81 (-) Transcript_42668:8-250(-)
MQALPLGGCFWRALDETHVQHAFLVPSAALNAKVAVGFKSPSLGLKVCELALWAVCLGVHREMNLYSLSALPAFRTRTPT